MPAPRDPLLQQALAELGCHAAGQLHVGDVSAASLAQSFGTPLYAFDASVLRRRLLAVQQALGERFTVLYSLKANPNAAIAAVLRKAGAGVEVASAGELCVAEAAGWDPATVRFAGPGKSEAELQFALLHGLGCCHVESLDEVELLAATAAHLSLQAGVAVRVNLPSELSGSRMRMSGRHSRFGVDLDQVPALLQRIAALPALQLRGLHVYSGTQLFDAAAFIAHARALCAAMRDWEQQLSLRLLEIDLGGGFGVPTYADDPRFDLAVAARGLRELLAEHDQPDRSWFVELGRYLTAPAGVYLARVLSTKVSGGERFAVLDGGLHQCALAAGAMAVLKRPPLVVHAAALQQPATLDCHVGGPLCTPADELPGPLQLPEVRRSDLLAVLNVGAYGLTFSPQQFLSHPAPAEVLVDQGVARLVRQRGSFADALLRQQP